MLRVNFIYPSLSIEELRHQTYKYVVLTLVEDVEKDEDVMQDPIVLGLVHDEESLEKPKKLKGTAWR